MPSLFHPWEMGSRSKEKDALQQRLSCSARLKLKLHQWWFRDAAAAFLLIAFIIALVGIASLVWLGTRCGWPMRSLLIPVAGLILFGAFLNEVSEVKSRDNIRQELSQFNWRRLVIRTFAWGSLAYAAHYIFNPCD